MAIRKKGKGKKTGSAPRSIRELVRRARVAGYDTLGLTSDPEALGHLEFVVLVRTFTERLTAKFERGSGRYAEAIGTFMWEPVAKCVVRAMIRRLCEGTRMTTEGCAVSHDVTGLHGIAREALASVRARLGSWVTGDRFDRVAQLTVEVFMDTERFSQPAQLKCREVPYTFHRNGDVLDVMRGGV